MAIKYTLQGLLVYLALAFHLLAFLGRLMRFNRLSRRLYLGGFVTVVLAFVYRWLDVGHVPLQSLFEVFLCLGMVYPLSLFCRRFLGAGGETADMLLGFVVLFPAGFVFDARPLHLPPALQSPLFVPHVAAYMAAYIILTKAAVQAAARLLIGPAPAEFRLATYETAAYRLVCLGFPLLTLGLILGSIWGKLAWGDYWHWDPKELWSLVSWLIYLIYLHVRRLYGPRYPRLNSVLVLLGLVAIVITLLWVNLSRLFPGLHSYAGA